MIKKATGEQMSTLEEKLLYPKPGSKISAARDFGIDLTLLLGRLRSTPEERLQDLQDVMMFDEEIRGAARKAHDQGQRNAPCTGRKRR